MARRSTRLRNRQSKSKVDAKVLQASLDYHEGLSANQSKIILCEFGFGDRIDEFNDWMFGQTCPVVVRHDRKSGEEKRVGGIYEYDLFRWIEAQKTKVAPVWD